MPRFFIHIRNELGDQNDDTGGGFADARLAMAEAAKMAGQLLSDEVHDGLTERQLRVLVEDENRTAVGEIGIQLSLRPPT